MKIKTLAAGSAAIALCACSLAPGPYLDSKRLDESAQAQQEADRFPVQPIDVAWFRDLAKKETAAVNESTCPLSCVTPATRGQYQYRVGINDQLTIIVWDHPELTGAGFGSAAGSPPLPQGYAGYGAGSPAAAAGGEGAGSAIANGTAPTVGGGGGEAGLTVRIAADGTFFFPRVGRVQARGKTAAEIQHDLTKGLAKTIRDPQIDVRVSGFNSQIVQVTGSVRAPVAESITDLPLSVIDAINRAGGAQADADLQNVGVTRNGKRYTIDVAALLDTGDPQQNVLLKDGDIVDVPDRANSRVFVLGEVAKPTSLPMNRGKLTLADALTGAGSLDVKTGDPHFIYVIRGADKLLNPVTRDTVINSRTLTPTVFRLDMTQVDALLLMTKFDLQPKDVVYVQVANSARFNRALQQITPTLETLFFTRQLTR